MLNFNNIEDLVTYMFESLDNEDNLVSVIANKDITVEIMKELLAYDNVILDLCNVNSFEYDREYLLSLHDETNTDHWHVSVEQIYNYDKEIYLGTSGYVLFHEDVNSKALVDMQNNENIQLSEYDLFIIGEDDEETVPEDFNISDNYTINGKIASKAAFDNYISKLKGTGNESSYTIITEKNIDVDEIKEFLNNIRHDFERDILDMRPYPFWYMPRIFC